MGEGATLGVGVAADGGIGGGAGGGRCDLLLFEAASFDFRRPFDHFLMSFLKPIHDSGPLQARMEDRAVPAPVQGSGARCGKNERRRAADVSVRRCSARRGWDRKEGPRYSQTPVYVPGLARLCSVEIGDRLIAKPLLWRASISI